MLLGVQRLQPNTMRVEIIKFNKDKTCESLILFDIKPFRYFKVC